MSDQEQFIIFSSFCLSDILFSALSTYSTKRVAVPGGFICTFFRVVQFTVLFLFVPIGIIDVCTIIRILINKIPLLVVVD